MNQQKVLILRILVENSQNNCKKIKIIKLEFNGLLVRIQLAFDLKKYTFYIIKTITFKMACYSFSYEIREIHVKTSTNIWILLIYMDSIQYNVNW